jgi:hypothetical protein
MQRQEFTTEIGGKTLTAEFTDLADQADGSVIVRYGNTTVMATAVMGREERVGLGYFPLTVDYEEKHYAAGAILGSRFMRREGRPSDEAILTGRIVGATNRVLQGDPTDPASYPGYEAANASVEVRGALHRRIKIALQVRLNGGDRQSTLAKIRSAVASAIMSYPHGKPIPISEAISAATLVEGVESVVPITTYDSTHDLIPVPADEKVIVYPDEDVSVTVGS